jgi:parvulin-like peptidyl-prolyl isomerase
VAAALLALALCAGAGRAPAATAEGGAKVKKETAKGAAAGGAQLDGETVAVAGGQVITRKELYDRLASEEAKHQLLIKGVVKVRELFLRDLIDQRLAVLDAERLRLREDPEFKGLTETAIDNWLAKEYQRTVLAPAVAPTAEQLRPYRPERFERIRVSEIAVATEDEAKELRGQLVAGADFAALAREHTIAPGGAEQGGDLGWLTRGGRNIYDKELIEPLFALKTKELSPVMRTPLGWEIFRLEERADLTPEEADEFMANPRVMVERENAMRMLKELYAARNLTVDEKAVDALFANPRIPGDTLLGSVGGWKLTATTYRAYLAGFKNPAQRPPTRTRDEVRKVVEGLLGQHAMRQVVEEQGALKDPKKKETAERFVTETLGTFQRERIIRGVSVTPAEVRAYYKQQKASLPPLERVRIRIITVAEPERAQMIYQRLREGRPWDQLAQAYSVDPTSTRGGDLGWKYYSEVDPALIERVRAVKTGGYTEPFDAKGLWVILSVTDRDGPRPMTESEAQELLREPVLAEKQTKRLDEYYDGLRKIWPVTINQAVVDSIVPPPGPSIPGVTPPAPVPAGIPAGHPTLKH